MLPLYVRRWSEGLFILGWGFSIRRRVLPTLIFLSISLLSHDRNLGKNDTMMAVAVLGIGAVAVYMFRDRIFGGGFGGGGEGTPDEEGELANRCWAIGNGRLGCSCAGQQYFVLNPGATCSNCEASCRGAGKKEEHYEFLGPYGNCSKKRKCNCSACCATGTCQKHKNSSECPCKQIALGMQQRKAAEEDIYSYYGTLDFNKVTLA